MPKIRDGGFRALGTGFGAAQSLTSLPYLNSNKAVGKARGQISKVAGQVNDAINTAHKINTGINQAASAVGDVLGLFGITSKPAGNTENEYANYKVKIFSQKVAPSPVMGYLQGDSLDMSMSSNWENAFDPITSLLKSATKLATATTGSTALPRFMTRRVWAGTSPLKLTIPLKFQSIDADNWNVMASCQALQMMVSPGVNKSTFTLIPPGPNPYSINSEQATTAKKAVGKTSLPEKVVSLSSTGVEKVVKPFVEKLIDAGLKYTNIRGDGDSILINIGNFLTFTNVVITDLNIKYATKLRTDGSPASAEAIITFETYEVLTKEAVRSIYNNPRADIAPNQKGDKKKL